MFLTLESEVRSCFAVVAAGGGVCVCLCVYICIQSLYVLKRIKKFNI